jgi:uncharacterized protein YjaG (DUF416 family)
MKELNHWQRATFCAALCERHFPHYQLFSDIEDQADAKLYRNSLDKVWDFLLGQTKVGKNFESALEKIEAILPDPKNFDVYGVYPALDALTALIATLQQCMDEKVDETENLKNLTRSTLAQFLEASSEEELSDVALEQCLEHSPLLEEQQTFEDWIIAQLSEGGSHKELVKIIRPGARNNGTSLLGISCD